MSYEVHVTKDGKRMLIGQMESSHLLNTIKLLGKNIEEAQSVIAGSQAFDSTTQILSGFDQRELRDVAAKTLKAYHEKMQPYVFEAALRGINIASILQRAYGRVDAIPTFEFQPQLAAAFEEDDNDVDYDYPADFRPR